MTQDDLRIALTVLSFVVFVGIAIWAFSRKRKRAFDDAANAPFAGRDFGPDADSAAAGKKEDRHE